jgi:hypothetical protein
LLVCFVESAGWDLVEVLVSEVLALEALLALPFRLFYFFFLGFVGSDEDLVEGAAEEVEAWDIVPPAGIWVLEVLL